MSRRRVCRSNKRSRCSRVPDCDAPAKQDGDEYLKTLEYSVARERWLKSGVLLLAVHDEWTRNGGDFLEGSETVTIVFDAEHKVSIQLGISAGVMETISFPI